MERYNKKTMNVYSKEYDELLKKEIEVWSKYSSGDTKISSYAELKNTGPYLTYRKGNIEIELEHISKLGNDVDVLELGSADGWLTNEILKLENVRSVTSIDISFKENLKEKYTNKTFALKGDLNKIDEIKFDKKYSCIITHGTLHHLVNPKNTLEYCIDNLLNDSGIIIINDTWIHQALQLKANAFFYTFFNRLPHAILDSNILLACKILFYIIPKIIFSTDFAASVAHAHETSPFESISSADDYKDIYKRKGVEIVYFKNLASLSGLQNSWIGSPLLIKILIQKMDDFLLFTKLFVGDYHICILKNKNYE